MQNENISNELLDHCLALARTMPPLATLEDIEVYIREPQVLMRKPFSKNLKFSIMASFIVLVSALVASFFFHQSKNIATLPVQSKQDKTQSLSPVLQGSKTNLGQERENLPVTAKKHPYMAFLGPTSAIEQDMIAINDLRPLAIPFASVPVPTHGVDGASMYPKQASSPFSIASGVKPVKLDKKHLAKMGFDTKVKYLEYQANIAHYGSLQYFNKGKESGYGTSPAKNMFQKTYRFYPAYISYTDEGHLDSSVYLNLLNVDSIIHINPSSPWEQYSNYDKDMSLLPVLFKQSDYDSFQGHRNLIFWFTVTPELKSILADTKGDLPIVQINRYAFDYRKSHPNASAVPPCPTPVQAAGTKPETNLKPHAQGIKILTLSDRQLGKVGFKISHDRIEYKSHTQDGNYFHYFNKGGRHELTIRHGEANDSAQDFCPVYITDLNGKEMFRYTLLSAKKSVHETSFCINTLVPLLVHEHRIGHDKNLIFWFNMTPSFLKVLPDSISAQMEKEYNELVKDSAKQPEQTASVPYQYFDAREWATEKKYGLLVFPNPTANAINIYFAPPKNDGTVYANTKLTDLSGKVVGENNFPWYGRTASYSAKALKLKPGIYLLTLTLNTGETLTTRVLVEKTNQVY